MSPSSPGFYVTGGSLRGDNPSYVQRNADQQLFDALQQGEFCYILTPRQMGKSSLMASTAARLRAEGIQVVTLDLTAIGHNLTVEQWYYGLLGRAGEQLDLEDAIDAFWLGHERLGPLRRFMTALRQVVLVECCGRLVVSIDEIDVVRSLPFATDEFFAAIRECYNRRTEDREFERLTFCLLGVASPTDLIRDTRMTPFNIGRRIELNDFSPREAAPLAQGLLLDPPCTLDQRDVAEAAEQAGTRENSNSGRQAIESRKLLDRILYWTGGHPYLTQRLCLTVALYAQQSAAANPASDTPGSRPRHWSERGGYPAPSDVDRLCSDLFLSHRAQERDNNLIFVRERLLRSEADLSAALELYRQVWRGKRVDDDDTNVLVSLLRLSGIARVEKGRLVVRNRIYARVFEENWVRMHMPDAELQRQKSAYRRGVLRTLVGSTAVVAVMAFLAASATLNARTARANAITAQQREKQANRNLYVADMNLANQALDLYNLPRALELLNAHRPTPNQPEDLRGFEWRLLWKRCQGNQLYKLQTAAGKAIAVAYSPDGRTLAAGDEDGTIQLLDAASKQAIALWKAHIPSPNMDRAVLHYSPDGKLLASSGWEGNVKLWDTRTNQLRAILRADPNLAEEAAFSPDGRWLVTCGDAGIVRLWDVASGKERDSLRPHTGMVWSVQFSPDGKLIATGGQDGSAKLWSVSDHRVVRSFPVVGGNAFSVAFSPDGKTLAVGETANVIHLWEVATGVRKRTLCGHVGMVRSVAFSPDGRWISSGSNDGTARLWNAASGETVRVLLGHMDGVEAVAFSPNGTRLATASRDRTLSLWEVTDRDRNVLHLQAGAMFGLAFSPDGKLVAAGGEDNTKRLIDVASRREIATLNGHTRVSQSLAFSPNGHTLAVATGRYAFADVPCPVELWDIATHKQVGELKGHTGAVMSVSYSPDSRMMASGSNDGTVKLWDVAARKFLATFPAEKDWLVATAFSRDGRTLAVGGAKMNRIDLWDVTSRCKIASIPASSNDGTTCPAYSPNGKMLAFGDASGIRIVDLATMRMRSTLRGHVNGAYSIAFSPDSRTLASGGGDGSVRLWNLETMAEVWAFHVQTGEICSVAFSPNGNLLAAGSGDGTLRFWEAAPFPEAGIRH